jgi:hypothetical protein
MKILSLLNWKKKVQTIIQRERIIIKGHSQGKQE